MLTYTTHLKRLILPEYGRNIQKMVDHCLSIPDRNERTRCAATIVRTMEQLFPIQGNTDDYRRKLWDHLAIMSDFNLDIDLPFELVNPGSLASTPTPLAYEQNQLPFKHYGLLLPLSVRRAAQMPQGEEKDALILLIANHIKKILLSLNPEGIDDSRVFKDLRILSDGEISLNPGDLPLHDFKIIAQPTGKKKKKK